jgi:ferric-dicitrate binding protein FerR (iron transport regulator)
MDRNILYHFFDGEATPEEEWQIVEWVDCDPVNEKIFNAEREIYNTMLVMREKDIPVVCKPKMRLLPRWSSELMRTAVAVAIAVGGVYHFYSYKERCANAAETSVSVPVGQQLDVDLPDGTRVTMNGSSRLTWPAVFSKKERRVRLSGEAYFSVMHEGKHPFVVETSQYNIEVLGTEFNVEAYEGSEKFSTSLVKGRVKVISNDDPKESVVLLPKQMATFADGKLVVRTIPESENFQWRNGVIAFHCASFKEMMELLKKYYGVSVIYEKDELPVSTFSGKIHIGEGIENALWALRQSNPFEYEYEKDTESITIK